MNINLKSIKIIFTLAFLLSGIGFINSQTITTAAGTGTAGFSGDNGLATLAQVNAIYGQIAIDNSGNIIFTDVYNQRIRKITTSTGSITTIAGTGVVGFAGDGTVAVNAQFNYPNGLAIDNSGNIFIADIYNHRIRRIDLTGNISTICGNGTASSTGDGGLATAATINAPGHIWIDPAGNLYITEYEGNRVRKIATTGTITTFCGTGVNTNTGDGGLATAATIFRPWEIAGDANGNIFVASYQGSYVRKIASSGSITAFAGISASPGYSGDGGAALTAQLNGVTGLGVNTAGDIFIADSANHRIRRVAANGTITTIAGTGTLGFSGDGGNPTAAQIRSPNGSIAVSGCTLYFIDAGNARIRKIVGVTPTVTAVSNATNYICVGETATLTGGGASYYSWNPGGNGNTISISPTVTSSYTVTGTAANGCQNTSVLSQSVSPCTNILQFELNNNASKLNVFPNPTTGQIIFDVKDADYILISDILGREIKIESIVNGRAVVDISDSPNGIYFLKIYSGNKLLSSQKLIKQ